MTIASSGGPSVTQARDSRETNSGYEVGERLELANGFFKFEEITLKHRRFDGTWSRLLKREQLHIGGTVIILPYDWQRDEVLLIEQFRCGGMETSGGPWIIECVAGLLKPDEDLALAASRELTEESGLTPRRLEKIGVYMPNPAVTTEYATMFVADADLVDGGGIFGLVEEDEDIRTLVLPAAEAFDWIAQGQIICANALIPLRWLQVHREALRDRWQKAAHE